ncbi:unnamed protein product [Meloidogyne enterolobii]|uniref:Uncharacterized protein n=1 Tax=Meloidogyne enterolobii TaxID=390850 RepID=A0ACB1AVV5_MELEN
MGGGGRRGPKARSDSKWKDESNRREDEGRRPEVTLSGRMRRVQSKGRRGPKARSDSKLKGESNQRGYEGRRPEVTLIERMSPIKGDTRAEGPK